MLKTFINAKAYDEKTLMYQTIIHMTFLFSALAIAVTDYIMEKATTEARKHGGANH